MFHNNYGFRKKIDKLPGGVEWMCDPLTITGDRKGKDGKALTEDLELWLRDPVDAVKDLIGNPALREHMTYAPQKLFEDMAKEARVWEEMHTADWWWETQVSHLDASTRRREPYIPFTGQDRDWRNHCAHHPSF